MSNVTHVIVMCVHYRGHRTKEKKDEEEEENNNKTAVLYR